MNHYTSLSLEKVTRDVRVIKKYQQNQMILRALMCTRIKQEAHLRLCKRSGTNLV